MIEIRAERTDGSLYERPTALRVKLTHYSIFPLTALVQRIALEQAEALGTDPDAFGYDVPGRRARWERIGL